MTHRFIAPFSFFSCPPIFRFRASSSLPPGGRTTNSGCAPQPPHSVFGRIGETEQAGENSPATILPLSLPPPLITLDLNTKYFILVRACPYSPLLISCCSCFPSETRLQVGSPSFGRSSPPRRTPARFQLSPLSFLKRPPPNEP